MKSNHSKALFTITFLSPIAYFILLIILGRLWTGYNPISTGMSELGAVDSPYRDIMNFGGFSTIGFVLALFGYGIGYYFNSGKAAQIASILTIIVGLGMFTVGFFPCDSMCIDVTMTGKLHSLFSTIPAILIPTAAMLSAHIYSSKLGNKVVLYYSY